MNIPLIASLFALSNFFRSGSPTPTQRKHLFHLVLSFGFIATLLISRPLWTSSRGFPIVPLFGEGWTLPLVDQGMFIFLLVAAISTLLLPRRDLTTGLTALGCFLAMAEDINRVQPWMWYFTLAWTALAVSHQKDRNFLSTLRWLTVCIYFWSGVHKINFNFFDQAWPYFMEGLVGSPGEQAWLGLLAYAVPIIESGLGLSLLFPKSRRFSVPLLIGMHLFILLAIGPTGKNWNPVVWPWNLVMVLNLLVLFSKDSNWIPQFRPQRRIFHNLVLLMFGLMPLLHVFDLWHGYMSWSIYSLKQSALVISADAASYNCIPEEVRPGPPPAAGAMFHFYLLEYSESRLGAPHFPHPRVYEAVVADLCQSCSQKEGLNFVEKVRRARKWKQTNWECPAPKDD